MRLTRFSRPAIIALVTFLLGGGFDYCIGIETRLGLDSLFQIRGLRKPPSDVVIVAMDPASDKRLNAKLDLTSWRGFHAKLIKELQRQQAALIVFDLQFITSKEHDEALAEAMQAAGNVLVTECVQKIWRELEYFNGQEECSESNKNAFSEREDQQQQLPEQLILLHHITPNALLAKAMLDHTPFYLAKDGKNPIIRESWTFIDALAELPTLPILTWFYYLDRTHTLRPIIQPTYPLSTWLTEQRRQCLAKDNKTLPYLVNTTDTEQAKLKKQINAVLCQQDSRYLDFYGPPNTIRTVSYSDVYDGKISDLKDKVVFVGKASLKFFRNKTDSFLTPFTDNLEGEMAGVEIMATQFANLLEGRFVTSPLPPGALLFTFGLLISCLLTEFAGFIGIVASILLSCAYVGLALGVFTYNALWLPVAVPILLQLPIAWSIALWWSRHDLERERERILAFILPVFPRWINFIPAKPGQWYPEKENATLQSERNVHGLCLATDIEGYTSVAQKHTPNEMWELLNKYYQVLGRPVSSNKGIIADVTGDAMMAVWIALPGNTQRLATCLAALEMRTAVELFNQAHSTARLPTRIGLHEGDMTLGSLGAGKVNFFRAIGDTVNTASRIQGANKFLGTKILASAAVVVDLTKIVYRSVGYFRLMGRTEAVELVEIVGKELDINIEQYMLYEQFATALSSFRLGRWQEASIIFQMLSTEHGDGPSKFYLQLALTYQNNPPTNWDGVVLFPDK